MPGLANHHGRDRTEYSEYSDGWSVSTEDSLPDQAIQRMAGLGITYLASEFFREIVEHDVNDQVVRVQADLPASMLNLELAKTGQCIPFAQSQDEDIFSRGASIDSIGSLISMNLPHALQAQCGSWRDWILGMTVVLADGTVAKCGSKAVKNVAGYDVQKLFVGGRDTLGIIYEVTLRTFPLKSLPKLQLERNLDERGIAKRQGEIGASSWWLQRVAATDWATALSTADGTLAASDHAAHILYALVPEDSELPRYPGDWVIRSGCGEKNLQITDPTQILFMQRAKQIFDPTNKLNPGEMGIF